MVIIIALCIKSCSVCVTKWNWNRDSQCGSVPSSPAGSAVVFMGTGWGGVGHVVYILLVCHCSCLQAWCWSWTEPLHLHMTRTSYERLLAILSQICGWKPVSSTLRDVDGPYYLPYTTIEWRHFAYFFEGLTVEWLLAKHAGGVMTPGHSVLLQDDSKLTRNLNVGYRLQHCNSVLK